MWERKYEIDSLCYPLRLTYLYWQATGDASVLDESFIECAETVIALWRTEQHHLKITLQIQPRNTQLSRHDTQ